MAVKVSGIDVIDNSRNLVNVGTVDGRDVSADGVKLDGIEAGATADQTKADIDALGINATTLDGIDSTGFALTGHNHTGVYEPADATILKDADIGVTVQGYSSVLAGTTASYTTAEETKLAGIEALADVTDAGNVNPLVDTHLNTGTATTGQYLGWNGADYAWSTVSGYTDTDVDTHLNTGTATTGEVLSWTGADYDWVAVSVPNISIDANSVAIGVNADNFYEGVTVGLKAGTNGGVSQGSIAIGHEAGRYIKGSYNIGIGVTGLRGGFAGLTSSHNTGIGYQTGYDLSTGAHNFLGCYQAGANLTTGSNNVAIGNGALDAATTAGRNIAIGQDAMGLGVATAASGNNVSIGYQAALATTTGFENVAIGKNALDANTAGVYNVAIGTDAAGATTGGAGYTAIGYKALQSASFGPQTALGYYAGGSVTTGQNNTFLGTQAGATGINDLTTGSNNTLIGNYAEASSATVSNEITLGDAAITRFRIPAAGIDNTSDALTGTTPSVDVGARDTYTLTTSGNTTFTFTGAPSSGQVGTFSLIITAGGTHTLTWPASVDWAGGVAPDAPASGEKDIYTFMTIDGGTIWYGFLAGDAVA